MVLHTQWPEVAPGYCTRQHCGVGGSSNDIHSVVGSVSQTSEEMIVGVSVGDGGTPTASSSSRVGESEAMAFHQVWEQDPVSQDRGWSPLLKKQVWRRWSLCPE